MEEPKVTIGKNAKYQLVNPTITKGFHVTMAILPTLKKMGFIDDDLQKFPELEMKWYMIIIQETKDGPIHVVPMEWVRV